MKPRNPNTYPGAVTLIMGVMGPEEAGQVVGKTAGLIRAWGDPDKEAKPSIEQAEALDRAYQAAGFGEPPIMSVYRRRLADAAIKHEAINPAERVMEAVGKQGDLVDEIRASMGAHGPAGCDWSPCEKVAVLAKISELQASLDALIRDVEAQETPSPRLVKSVG